MCGARDKSALGQSEAKLCRIPSRTLNHEPENLHDDCQRDLWSSSAGPCITNFPWLVGPDWRLERADVVELDRSRCRRRLELLRNKPHHARPTQRKLDRFTLKQALIGAIGMSALGHKRTFIGEVAFAEVLPRRVCDADDPPLFA